MAAPVQIVLNQESFEEVREKNGGGPKKDFFAHKDREFERHRDEISKQLSSVAEALGRRSTGNIGVLKLILRRSAWAKSHRPIRALFKQVSVVRVFGTIGSVS